MDEATLHKGSLAQRCSQRTTTCRPRPTLLAGCRLATKLARNSFRRVQMVTKPPRPHSSDTAPENDWDRLDKSRREPFRRWWFLVFRWLSIFLPCLTFAQNLGLHGCFFENGTPSRCGHASTCLRKLIFACSLGSNCKSQSLQ